MPAVSPYQANDYQAVSNYRPYELPINDIFKAISAQNQFWDAGAAKVKSVYENALNLSLTTEENKNIRKQFMQDADKQLTKLSTMDLGDASVVRQGFNLYKPLFKNKEIMYDNQLTELQSSIFSEAQRYKKDEKTKGEGFHMDNLAYALMPFQGFGKDTRREDLEGIYNKAKNSEYIPYHNVQKSMKEISAACPANSYEGNSIQSLYFLNEKDESKTKEKLTGCIKAGLSGEDWQQLRISGAVHYRDNYKAISESYSPLLKGNNLQYAKEIIQAEIELKKNKGSKDFTSEMEKSYTDFIAQRKLAIENNDNEVKRLDAGDYSSIEKDKDNIISQVYGDAIINSYATAFSFEKISKMYTSNPSRIAEFTQGQINARADNENIWKQKEYELNVLKTLGFNGMGGTNSGTTGSAGGGLPYQALAQFSDIFRKYGIPDGFVPYLNEGVKVEGKDLVADVENSMSKYKNELSNSTDKLAYTLANLSKTSPDAIHEILKNKNEDLQTYAQEVIKNYYNTLKKGAAPSPEIVKLEEVLGSHMLTAGKATYFTNLKGKIDEEMKLHPEIEKSLKVAYNMFDLSNSSSIQHGWDPDTKKAVEFTPERVKNIFKGIDSEYTMKNGITYNKNGSKLGDVSFGNWINIPGFDLSAWMTNQINSYEKTTRRALTQNMVKDAYETFSSKVLPKIQDEIVNQEKWGVGNVPGLGVSIASEFNFIPEIANGTWKIIPTTSERLGDDIVTKFTIQTTGKDEDKLKALKISPSSMLLKRVKNSDYSINSQFNNVIVTPDGELAVKTNYLPMGGADFELKNVVESLVFSTKNIPLKSGETKDIPVTTLVGGYNMGFTVEGRGADQRGNLNQKVYTPYISNDKGEKVEGIPSIDANEISGQFKTLQQAFYQQAPYRVRK